MKMSHLKTMKDYQDFLKKYPNVKNHNYSFSLFRSIELIKSLDKDRIKKEDVNICKVQQG